MFVQEKFSGHQDESFTLYHACYSLIEEYRGILTEIGEQHSLSENEMLVLVHLALNPEACTQKKLQATNLHLSVSSICRMVESLRKKEYLTTTLDVHDRRSWIIHLEPKGADVATEFRTQIRQRLDDIFRAVPGFDLGHLASTLSQASGASQAISRGNKTISL